MPNYRDICAAAYEENMQLPKLGLVIFTFGNVSVADRVAGVFAIKPSGVAYEELSPEMMTVVDFDGHVVSGALRPSSDTKTHAVLYKHCPEIVSIAHTHSTYATAWAQSLRDIPNYGTTHADHLRGGVPCTTPMDDHLIEEDYEQQTGFQILDCLRERNLTYKDAEMILVGGHAPFAWGSSRGKAVYHAAVLEELARMAYLTERINPSVKTLKESLVRKHYERKHGKGAYYGQ